MDSLYNTLFGFLKKPKTGMFSFVVAAATVLALRKGLPEKWGSVEIGLLFFGICFAVYLALLLLSWLWANLIVAPFLGWSDGRTRKKSVETLHDKQKVILATLLQHSEKFVWIEDPPIEPDYFLDLQEKGLIDCEFYSDPIDLTPPRFKCWLTKESIDMLKAKKFKLAKRLGLMDKALMLRTR